MYVPPAGDLVELDLGMGGPYTPPSGDAVELNLDRLDAYIDFLLDGAGAVVDAYTNPCAKIEGRPEVLGDITAEFVPYLADGIMAWVLEDVVGDVAGEYDVNVWRGLWRAPETAWRREQPPANPYRHSAWRQAPAQSPASRPAWQAALPEWAGLSSAWRVPPRVAEASPLAFAEAAPLGHRAEASWNAPPRRPEASELVWEGISPRSQRRLSVWRCPPPQHRARQDAWQQATPLARRIRAPAAPSTRRRQAWRIVWHSGTHLLWDSRWPGTPYPRPPIDPPHYLPDTELVLRCPMPKWDGAHLQLVLTAEPCPWGQVVPITQGTSVMIANSLAVYRLEDNYPVRVSGIRVDLDWESWGWRVQLDLDGDGALAAISPLGADPVPVRVAINGYEWTAYIEDAGETREFGVVKYTASGRSLAAVLADPWAVTRSYTEEAQRTAAQLIDRELLNTGWSAEYHAALAQLFTVDWLVPGGVWSYQQKTPMEAIATIAKAAGARVYANRVNQILHVAPRYPIPVWDWATAVPDRIVPRSLTRQVAFRDDTRPAYNQVHVSGQNAGILATVRRTGTAGNLEAPMVTDPLITHAGAAAERGRTILCDSGKGARTTLELPLVASPGLLMPGLLLAFEGEDWCGQVTSVRVQGAFGQVMQTAEIRRSFYDA